MGVLDAAAASGVDGAQRTGWRHQAPRWLPGGNLQTIWPALFARAFEGPRPRYRRERWDTPDGDFIDVDFADETDETDETDQSGETDLVRATPDRAPPAPQPRPRPLLVLFHGLEGSSASHYALAFADFARRHGLAFAVPHFRGCSGEVNRAPRAYHSGDHAEVDWLLRRFRSRSSQPDGPGHGGPLLAVGISLGGNALLRWAGEHGEAAATVVDAVAAVSSPLDLAAGGHAIVRGFNRQVYNRMFMRSMVPKALERLRLHPGLFDRARLLAARDLYEFDNIFTAPVHGFRDTEDYWARASAKPHLQRIRIPALALNARNDPFVPAWSLPSLGEAGDFVTLWQPREGGHVGFCAGSFPGHVRAMPQAVGEWMLARGAVQRPPAA